MAWLPLEVCVPNLGTKRDKTRRDWRPFPNCRDRDGTTNVWSCCSGQYGKNSGKMGREVGQSWVLGTGNFPLFSGKNPVPGKWHSGTQTSSCHSTKVKPAGFFLCYGYTFNTTLDFKSRNQHKKLKNILDFLNNHQHLVPSVLDFEISPPISCHCLIISICFKLPYLYLRYDPNNRGLLVHNLLSKLTESYN